MDPQTRVSTHQRSSTQGGHYLGASTETLRSAGGGRAGGHNRRVLAGTPNAVRPTHDSTGGSTDYCPNGCAGGIAQARRVPSRRSISGCIPGGSYISLTS